MRDIRGDLQERGNEIEQQMNAAQCQFEQLLEQLKREQDSKVGDLKAQLAVVNKVMEIEHRLLGSATSATKFQPEPKQPLAPNADFALAAVKDIMLRRAS
jgi:hypothetical protein